MSGRCGSSSVARCSGVSFGPGRVAALVQLADQRLADPAPHLGREELADRRAGPDHRRQGADPRAVLDEDPGVVLGDRVDLGRLHAQEAEDPVQGDRRLVDELAVAQQQHPLAVDVLEQVGDLAAVHPEPLVVPERRPALVDALGLAAYGLDDVGARLEAVHPEVHPVGVGPVDRVAQHRDQLRLGGVGRDPAAGVTVVEVERRALAAQGALGRPGEEVEVALALPDPLLVGVRVAGTLVRRRRRVAAHVVLRLLHRRQEQPRVLGQRRVQGTGAGLGGADEEEVGWSPRAAHAPKCT